MTEVDEARSLAEEKPAASPADGESPNERPLGEDGQPRRRRRRRPRRRRPAEGEQQGEEKSSVREQQDDFTHEAPVEKAPGET